MEADPAGWSGVAVGVLAIVASVLVAIWQAAVAGPARRKLTLDAEAFDHDKTEVTVNFAAADRSQPLAVRITAPRRRAILYKQPYRILMWFVDEGPPPRPLDEPGVAELVVQLDADHASPPVFSGGFVVAASSVRLGFLVFDPASGARLARTWRTVGRPD